LALLLLIGAFVPTAAKSSARTAATNSASQGREANPEGAAKLTPGALALRYRVALESRVALVEGGEEIVVGLDGALDLARVPDQLGGAWLRGALVGPSLALAVGENAAGPGDTTAVERHLVAPFQLRLDAAGRVTELWLAPDLDALSAGCIRQLAAGQQLVREPAASAEGAANAASAASAESAANAAGGGGATAWTSVEPDLLGEATADYRELGPGRIYKVRTAIRTSGGAIARPAGATTFELDDAGLRRLELDETTALSGGGFGATAATRLALERDGDSAMALPPLAWAVEREAMSRTDLATPVGVDESALLRQRVAGASFAELIAALGPDGGDASARTATMVRLAALLALEPERAADVALAIGDGRGPATPELVGALASAGTTAAELALVGLATDPDQPLELRLLTTAQLGLLERPGGAALAALAAQAEGGGPTAGAATLGLGTQARSLATAGDDVGAGPIVERLLARLATAGDDASRGLIVDALGNSGDRRAFAALAELARRGPAPLRGRATLALRHIPGSDVDKALAEFVVDKIDADRGAAALDAARMRESAGTGLVGAVIESAARDPRPQLRLRAVAALAAHRARFAAAAEALAWVAAHDPDPGVRAAAAERLGP
jgi:hypothetical protein